MIDLAAIHARLERIEALLEQRDANVAALLMQMRTGAESQRAGDTARKKRGLRKLSEALGPRSAWEKAETIAQILRHEQTPPDGLENIVRELMRLGCTTTRSRIFGHIKD